MSRHTQNQFFFDRKAETMAREQLRALQTSHLQRILQHAYANVPHYRRSFDAAGVKPDQFRTLADI